MSRSATHSSTIAPANSHGLSDIATPTMVTTMPTPVIQPTTANSARSNSIHPGCGR